MAGAVVAWLCVWAGVVSGTEITKIHGRAPSVCEPDTRSSEVEFRAATEIRCAMLCSRRMAYSYTFNGTSCTLFGKTTLPASAITTFYHFPSPDTLEDIATGKVALGSSLHSDSQHNYTADKAVDTDSEDSSMFHSRAGDMSPWWLLDLGEMRTIHEIQILSRRGCCSERFHDVEIRVGEVNVTNGDFSSYTLFSTYEGPYTADQGRLTCSSGDGVRGRFVSVKKMKLESSSSVLQIVDVNVFVLKGN